MNWSENKLPITESSTHFRIESLWKDRYLLSIQFTFFFKVSKFKLNYPPFLISEIENISIYTEYDQCIYAVFLHIHTKNWDNNTFWIFRAFNSFWFTDIYGRLEIFRYPHILVLKSTFVEKTLKMPKLSHQSKIQTWNCKKIALISCLRAAQPA